MVVLLLYEGYLIDNKMNIYISMMFYFWDKEREQYDLVRLINKMRLCIGKLTFGTIIWRYNSKKKRKVKLFDFQKSNKVVKKCLNKEINKYKTFLSILSFTLAT